LLVRKEVTLEEGVGKDKRTFKVMKFDRPIQTDPPSIEERNAAEVSIHLIVQKLYLSKVLLDLQRNGKINHTHPLAKLQPQLDEEGVMRQASRLRYNKDVKKEIKFPIIVPASSGIVDLIIGDIHRALNHSKSVNHIFNEMSHYRLTKGPRELIKKFLRNCLRCRRLWPKPLGQQMAPLPSFRVPTGSLSPFSTTTLDAAGPFLIRQGRGKARLKRHLLIFTCATVRAVHIEVMYGVHTDDFLFALSRFCCERSRPEKIICDNAGQFTKGAKLLAPFDGQDTNAIQTKRPDIEFLFSPAYTPHCNGVTERMVRSMKTSLKHVISDGLLTDDEFHTAAKKVQAILNSRPLGYFGTQPEDITPLTPAHFLADKALKDITIDASHLDHKSRYKLVQHTLDDAWKRFQKEVIPKLNVINKWTKQHGNLEVGDVVVVMDAEETGKFPLGLVIETFPGSDGLVRIVKVRIRGHETKRHAARLMLLLREPRGEVA